MKESDKLFIRKEVNIQDIEKCIIDDKWGFGNSILYEMCSNNPKHNNEDVIVGKIWLIGRSYAAAIERRKSIEPLEVGEDFYTKVVSPKVLEVGEELDNRIEKLKNYDAVTRDNLKEIVDTHLFLTNIFLEISGLEKRSLASKYLHFHLPELFFIYDSRAIQAARKYIKIDKQLREELAEFGDKEYIELVTRLFTLQEYLKREHEILLSPREIDTFLLTSATK